MNLTDGTEFCLTVYVDIYFLVNAAADFLICCITGKVLHFKCRILGLLITSLCGGAFSVISLVMQNAAVSLFTALLSPPIMLFAAFGKMSAKDFFKALIVMAGCSFAAGGIFYAAESFLLHTLKPGTVFVICFLVFFFCFYFFDIFCFESELGCIEVTAHTERSIRKLKLMCDSGCLVREPIGGLPVILLSPRVFDELYPKNGEDAFYAVKHKMRAVPIKTASGSAVIYAVMPQKLTYVHKNKEKTCHAMLGRSITQRSSGMDGIFPQALL